MPPANTVRLLRVFVSSPGDVQDERDVLDEIVSTINDIDGEFGNFVVKLFKWDKNVTPRIGAGPQEVVDEQTRAYDIYLGIMSAWFGTPTDDYDSGTEQEFREALANAESKGEPWILFYFDDQANPGTDPETVEQYLSVCKFRVGRKMRRHPVARFAVAAGARSEAQPRVCAAGDGRE